MEKLLPYPPAQNPDLLLVPFSTDGCCSLARATSQAEFFGNILPDPGFFATPCHFLWITLVEFCLHAIPLFSKGEQACQ